MYQTEHAKRFRVFRNGDRGFLGKEVTVSRQNARNWDTFLQHITDDVKSTEAVRDLCTPTGGTRVTCYDDLVDKEYYVAVGRGKFRDIGYLSLDATGTPREKRSSWSGEDLKSLNQNRFKARSRIYEAASECDVVTIYVYANGDDINPPRRITLPHRILTDIDDVMEEINEHVRLPSGSAARLLYTVDGELIHQPHTQLENKAYYVAVGSEYGGFKQVKYGNPLKPTFVTYGTNRHGPDPSQRLRRKNESSSNSTSASSSIPPDALRYHKASSRSQIDLHNKQRAQRNGLRHSYGGNGPFHAKPANASNRYRSVNYDNDEGGVFKSKRTTRYTADEIQDSSETKTDLPLDQRRAEEVEEETSPRANYRRPARRAAPIGKKSTTNAHEDYALRPLNMRQSKVAKSFEAQRKNGDENEAVTQREAENQRCGPRVPNNYATRSQSRFNAGGPQKKKVGERTSSRQDGSDDEVQTERRRFPPLQQRPKPRIIEEEEQEQERSRMTDRNGVVQRKNERNKLTPRGETPDNYQRGGWAGSHRFEEPQPGRGSQRGNISDRSDRSDHYDHGSLTKSQQRGPASCNKYNDEDDGDDVPSPRKQRQYNNRQEKAAVKIQQSFRGYRARTRGEVM